MWNDCSEDVGAFAKLNNMEKNDIKGASEAQLVTSLNVFSAWMMSQQKTVLYGQKELCWSPESMFKTIGTFCVMLERKKYFSSCKVLKDWRYENWLKDF